MTIKESAIKFFHLYFYEWEIISSLHPPCCHPHPRASSLIAKISDLIAYSTNSDTITDGTYSSAGT